MERSERGAGGGSHVDDVLARFAGDSTQREFNGMVAGAFLSGVREAEKWLPLLYA